MQSRPLTRPLGAPTATRRRALVVAAAVLLPLAATACSGSDATESTTPASVSASDGAGGDDTTAPADTDATDGSDAAAGTDAPAAPDASDASDASDDAGGCSTIPSESDVEAIIGAPVLPVEEQSVGCAYLGDDNNVGVYFDITDDQFDLANFADPDPSFATMVDDPGLPAGSFVQSGDFFAEKNGVLYKVTAAVNGTVDDDELAKQLMIAWLALVP